MVRKTTVPKKTTAKRSTAKPATKPTAESGAKPVAKDEPQAATVVKSMGKRELIDRVVEMSGVKKKAAKPVVEAMLKELGDALSRGETLNLQPFGKCIVKARKDLENAEVVQLRLRRSKLALKAAEAPAVPTPRDPLAEAAE